MHPCRELTQWHRHTLDTPRLAPRQVDQSEERTRRCLVVHTPADRISRIETLAPQASHLHRLSMASPEGASAPAAMQDSRQHTQVDDVDAQHRGSTPGRHARGRHAVLPSQGGRGNRGGRTGRFESRSQQPGRWGHKQLPVEPVLPDNARQFGVVVTVKETFGFIKCTASAAACHACHDPGAICWDHYARLSTAEHGSTAVTQDFNDRVCCRMLVHARSHSCMHDVCRATQPCCDCRCYTGRRDQVFFHASELQAPAAQQPPAVDAADGKPAAADAHSASQQQQQQQQHGRGRPDLPSMVAPGTPVEFTVIEGDPAQKRRTVAVQVKPAAWMCGSPPPCL
jgi:hypothetical protein